MSGGIETIYPDSRIARVTMKSQHFLASLCLAAGRRVVAEWQAKHRCRGAMVGGESSYRPLFDEIQQLSRRQGRGADTGHSKVIFASLSTSGRCECQSTLEQ